jgi:FixJ family two-component response regulator
MSISILCVDDDPSILESYRRAFGRRYDVYLAQGPLQGLEKLELGPRYAVIITDKHMPDMDGVEFMRRVSERFPSAYRVMLTGDADSETAVDAVNRGNIQRFLQKPCPSSTLEKVIEEGVAIYHARQDGDALAEARRAAAQQLARVLAWTRPAAAELSRKALHRAQVLAGKKGQTLPEAAVLALQLAEIGVLSSTLEGPHQAQAGAALLGSMPGWEETADLFLQAHGLKPCSLLGYLLYVALDLERAALAPASELAPMERIRSRHLGNPWFRSLEEGKPTAERSLPGMAKAA